jgi:hypothetical protein
MTPLRRSYLPAHDSDIQVCVATVICVSLPEYVLLYCNVLRYFRYYLWPQPLVKGPYAVPNFQH